MDKNKLHAERERGAKAAQILDNVVYQEVWQNMENGLLTTLTDSSTPDEMVLEARRGLIVLRRLKSQIENELTTGKMAEVQLENELSVIRNR